MVVTTNCTISVTRPENGAFAPVVNEIRGFIEPASAEIVAMYDDGVPWGQLYAVFLDFMGVQIGDKIVIDGADYLVRGVKHFESIVGRHAEIVVRKSL